MDLALLGIRGNKKRACAGKTQTGGEGGEGALERWRRGDGDKRAKGNRMEKLHGSEGAELGGDEEETQPAFSDL